MVEEEMASDLLDALDRMVLEIQAMDAICNADAGADADENDVHKGFVVVSHQALEQAQSCLDEANASDVPSQIDVEAFVSTEACDENTSNNDGVRLRMSLPKGYPTIHRASVTVLHTPKFVTRGNHDTLSSQLQATANELIGSEAMMSIISECRNILSDLECNSSDDAAPSETKDDDTTSPPIDPVCVSRRWIWVHHITNNDRRKQIVIEAQDRNLGGFLKAGYPGVVCVEGDPVACDDFVVWIKGNKSRPGGFGRNWGHHVRGEATTEQRQLPEAFEELEDDMGVLGSLCRESNVEDEFREFILQQK